MKLTDRQQRLVDTAQWVMIGLLMVFCMIVFIGNNNIEREKDFQRQETYIKIYDSHKIVELEKKNAVLTDSIEKMKAYIDALALK